MKVTLKVNQLFSLVGSWNKQIMGIRSMSSKREATFISLREAEMAVKRKGFIVSLGMENKNFLQKLLKDDCIYWRLKLVFEDKRVLRKDFGNVLKYVDREYWNGRLN